MLMLLARSDRWSADTNQVELDIGVNLAANPGRAVGP